jgi:hypothetical protein
MIETIPLFYDKNKIHLSLYSFINIVYIIKYFKNNVRRVQKFHRRKKNIIYERNTVCTTFGHRKSVYCDFIASGLASKFVEDYIKDNIFSKYSNTHSNSTNGICNRNIGHPRRH